MEIQKRIVFLCGLGDFHAFDWYRSCLKLLNKNQVLILTDSIKGEGLKNLSNENDKIHNFILIDKILFKNQSVLANKWRNFLKLLMSPLQILKLRYFATRNPDCIYFAHGMYFMFLANLAKVPYIGAPQGGEILLRPNAFFYRKFAQLAIKGSVFSVVDSVAMQEKSNNLFGVKPVLVQNGIDLISINKFIQINKSVNRFRITSVRGLTPLYRIDEILASRDLKNDDNSVPITFIYPFFENEYKDKLKINELKGDIDLGRLEKESMYKVLSESSIVISIPESDSSPRSVYEAIFCGCIVVITENSYFNTLPKCMKERIVIADIANENWFSFAIEKANKLKNIGFLPDKESQEMFNQELSMKKVLEILATKM